MKNWMLFQSLVKIKMQEGGLEPPPHTRLAPKASASANSATLALKTQNEE